jgi:hypothetical protein
MPYATLGHYEATTVIVLSELSASIRFDTLRNLRDLSDVLFRREISGFG